MRDRGGEREGKGERARVCERVRKKRERKRYTCIYTNIKFVCE